MNTRNTLIYSTILIVIAIVAGLLLWNRLPEQMASHWDNYNQVNGYISRFWGVFLMPMITVGMLLLFIAIPQIDPLKANIAQFREYYNTFIFLLIVFMDYMQGLTLAWNLGYNNFNMGTAMLPAMGLFFIYAGVLMANAKRNFFIGIRTPWTLSSDSVWEKTHALGSKLFIASGILALLGIFAGPYAIWLMMVPLLGSALFLIVYSYVLYQQENRQSH
jgi:uncharacterized membrane protein